MQINSFSRIKAGKRLELEHTRKDPEALNREYSLQISKKSIQKGIGITFWPLGSFLFTYKYSESPSYKIILPVADLYIGKEINNKFVLLYATKCSMTVIAGS